MSDLSTRAFRIVPPDPGSAPVAPSPPAHAGAGFDYAGLAEKARATREARDASRRRREPGPGRGAQARVAGRRTGATPEPGPEDARAESDALGLERDAGGRVRACGAADADIGDDEALGPEVAHAAWPVVNEVSRVADAFAVMLVSLAREIAAFCAVPAISQGGQWEAQVPLDARSFPHTTLHLALSPFALSLRFDCRDPTVRQLLCDHEAALRRELGKLMEAWGEPRVIEISAW